MTPLTTGRIHTARFLVGDVLERLGELPDASVDLVVTSPPFLALRSYLPADHPDKGREIGSEATPAEYLDVLLQLTAEWSRVLAPHGSLAVELGDTYAGSGGAGGDYNPEGLREGQERFNGSAKANRGGLGGRASMVEKATGGHHMGGPGWPLDKSLTGVPTLYAWSLAYGHNLLTGQPSPAGQWRIRNLVAWVRPNPPVGALADKYRPATSYITVATRARDRWFDLDAVRGEVRPENHRKTTASNGAKALAADDRQAVRFTQRSAMSGSPPLDWWEIPPGGYSGAHYAVFPPELPRRLIDSMCPRRVCTTCGNPSRRITGEPTYVHESGRPVERSAWPSGIADGKGAHSEKSDGGHRTRAAITTGWSSCGCPNTDGLRLDGFHAGTGWRPGVVLDPFVGSGTTLAVASGMGRDSIGIDLDSRNADLARERVGMFLDIDEGSLFEEANDAR